MNKLWDKDRLKKRLMEKTIIKDNHWLWTGRKKDGYGMIWCGSRESGWHMKVSRLSAYIFLGLDLHSELQANHKLTCPYKNCWNPNCLYVGTVADNGKDYRESRVTCKNEHDLSIHGKLVRRYSWNPNIMRLKCQECERIIKQRSQQKKRVEQ